MILLSLLILLITIGANAQTASTSPLMINKTTAVTSNSLFWVANSNSIFSLVAPNSLAERTLVVSAASGNDTYAVGATPTTPFLTIGAALSNAPAYSRVIVLPGVYNVTPSYNTPSTTTAADFTYVPALLLNKTNVSVEGRGAVITGSGTGCIFGLLNCKDVSISGFEFNLTKGIGEELTNSYIGSVTLYGTNVNCSLDNNIFRNSTSHAITGSKKIYGLNVRNCYFQNIGSTNTAWATNSVAYPYPDGAAISGLGSDTYIQGCKFYDNIRDVQWEGDGTSTIRTGLTIQGCTSSNCIQSSIYVNDSYTNATTLRNINISGNVFHGNQSEYAVNSRDSSSWTLGLLTFRAGAGITISGNNLYNVYDYGIFMRPSSPIEDVLVTGNNLVGAEYGWTNGFNFGMRFQASSFNSTNVYGLKNISTVGNSISHFGSSAIRMAAANTLCEGDRAFDVGKYDPNEYVFWAGGVTGSSNIVFRGCVYSDHKSSGQNHLFGVSDPAKSVYIDRSNFGRNIETSLSTTPATVDSSIYTEVFLDGKTFTATLVGGTVTVTYPLIHSGSRIIVTRNVTGGTVGHLSVTRVNETSFTVNSTSATDTSTLAITINEDYY